MVKTLLLSITAAIMPLLKDNLTWKPGSYWGDLLDSFFVSYISRAAAEFLAFLAAVCARKDRLVVSTPLALAWQPRNLADTRFLCPDVIACGVFNASIPSYLMHHDRILSLIYLLALLPSLYAFIFWIWTERNKDAIDHDIAVKAFTLPGHLVGAMGISRRYFLRWP